MEKQFNLFHYILEDGTVISGGSYRKTDFNSSKEELYNNNSDSTVNLGTLGEGLWKYLGREPQAVGEKTFFFFFFF